jgi:hypothetical protein
MENKVCFYRNFVRYAVYDKVESKIYQDVHRQLSHDVYNHVRREVFNPIFGQLVSLVNDRLFRRYAAYKYDKI